MMKRIDLKRRADWLSKAGILTEALPYMRRYNGKTVVIKYGGHAMGDADLALKFAADVVLLKQVGMNPVVVHGGGPQIGRMLERLAIKSEFIDGLRVTDAETVEIVEMVLSGSINKSIVAAINEAGGSAIGLSGKDGGLIGARKLRRTKIDPDSNIEKVLDLGFVGEPTSVKAEMLTRLVEQDMIPVVAPIGLGEDGGTYNINADAAAGAVAAAVDARRLDADGRGRRPRQGRATHSRAWQVLEASRVDGGWDDFRRHDPEDRDLPRGRGRWGGCCRDHRRSGPARCSIGTVHQPWHGYHRPTGRLNPASPRSGSGEERDLGFKFSLGQWKPAVCVAAQNLIIVEIGQATLQFDGNAHAEVGFPGERRDRLRAPRIHDRVHFRVFEPTANG